MPYASADEREVFVSRFNRVIAVLIWAATAAIAVGLLVSVHDLRLLYLVPCAFFALDRLERTVAPAPRRRPARV